MDDNPSDVARGADNQEVCNFRIKILLICLIVCIFFQRPHAMDDIPTASDVPYIVRLNFTYIN